VTLPLGFGPGASPQRILCIGAHCDDIEIGCGGTVLRLASRYPQAQISWLILSGSPERAAESRAAAALLGGPQPIRVRVETFPDGLLPSVAADVKARLVAANDSPDLVLTHFRGDAHQDHRLLGELCWQVFRRAAIWEYEIPKWDGDLGRPNLYVPLTPDEVRRKIDALLTSFPSQRSKHWFTADTFTALLRLRGIEAGTAHAEAFHAAKLVIDP
jgi:LmbE family N-acetylglucosaminyl deacetylase